MRKSNILMMTALCLGLMVISSCKKPGAAQNVSYDCNDYSTITTNTTLSAGIYTIDCSIEVSSGATLTISPGTTLLFTQGSSLNVDAGCSIVAQGTSSQPIVIKGTQDVPGYWQGIFIASISLNNTFSYCTISDGGLNSVGNEFGSDVTLGGTASFNNCTFSNSSGAGLYIAGNGSNNTYFNSFSNNTFSGNASYPLVTRARAAGTLGSGNTFTNTASGYDFIAIMSSTVTNNVTLAPQAIPYIIPLVNSGDAGITFNAALTISPGTQIYMGSGISILINSTGSMNAVGTASSPISFVGQQPTAGFWGSVIINSQNTLNNFQYCNFSYGGGTSGNPISTNQANVGMLSTYMYIPTARSLTVTNCSFSNSGSSGIYVSATDGPPTVPPTYNANITTANTFSGCSPNVQE